VHEGDQPDLVAGLFHSQLLPRKHLADIDLAALIAGAPAVRDDGRSIVKRIVDQTCVADLGGRSRLLLVDV
jgi:hypothetical protein